MDLTAALDVVICHENLSKAVEYYNSIDLDLFTSYSLYLLCN